MTGALLRSMKTGDCLAPPFVPTPQLRINFNVDLMYADNTFTRMSPRQLQHYVVRAHYQPRRWLVFSGAANIFEARNNVKNVNHLEHNRYFSFGTSITPGEKWSADLNYSYNTVFSTTLLCYASTPPPPNAGSSTNLHSGRDSVLQYRLLQRANAVRLFRTYLLPNQSPPR